MRHYPKKSFRLMARIKEVSDEERSDNLAKFEKKNARLVEMLTEIKDRLPWLRNTVNDLFDYVERNARLTPKQRSFVTSLYTDNCMISDARIREQVEARKLCCRLSKLNERNALGQIRMFVLDLFYKSDTRPFSARQIIALNNIANRLKKQLAEVPEYTDETFDGWFEIKKDVDFT